MKIKEKDKKEMFKDLVFMIIECGAKPLEVVNRIVEDYSIGFDDGKKYYWNWVDAGRPVSYIDIFK